MGTRSQVCLASGNYTTEPGMDDWCYTNCLRYPPNCPQDKCKCLESCDPVGSFKEQPGSETYCMEHCMKYPQNCKADRCVCY